MKKKLLLIILVCVAAVAAGLYVWKLILMSQIEVIKPERGKAIQAVYATGVVEPVFWSKVSATLDGRVAKILAKEGQKIKAGQILARLDDSVERAQLEELKATLYYLESQKQRQIILRKQDFASQRILEKTLSEYEQILAEINAQERLLDRMTIVSPMDGTVLKRDIELGEVVKAGQVIIWVGLTTPLRITAEVDEEDIPLVKVGQKVLIKADAFPERISQGTVMQITPKGDPIGKNFRVRISLPKNTPMLIGMTTEINIVVQEVENALLVPEESIADDQVIVKTDGKFTPRKVKIGIRGRHKIQILEGLDETDTILANPERYLRWHGDEE